MTTVLVTDTYTEGALARLRSQSHIHLVRTGLNPSSEELKNASVLLIRSRTPIHRQLLEQAPNLKLIVTATAGFDHIDFQECQSRDIKVAFTPEANVDSAAELTLLLMLMLVRKMPQVHTSVSQHQWRQENLRGQTLKGKALSIVGLGRIGQRVAELARALGMNIFVYDPYVEDDVVERFSAQRLGLTEALTMADILTLHVPLTSETKHLINHQTLPFLHRDVMLINASRGAVIDESELLVALDQKKIGTVALDVFEKEPVHRDSRLFNRSNVIMTPHIGAFTDEALEMASQIAVDKVICFLNQEPISDTLPLDVPWFNKILKTE